MDDLQCLTRLFLPPLDSLKLAVKTESNYGAGVIFIHHLAVTRRKTVLTVSQLMISPRVSAEVKKNKLR